MILDILKVFILSVVEAFTEFIPVSSTGHMIIVEHFLPLSKNKNFVNSFEIIIQLGAILAIIVLFFPRIFPFIYKGEKRMEIIRMWSKIIVAMLPAVFLGLLFDDYITDHLFKISVIAFTLLFYGVILILIENSKFSYKINDISNVSYKKALFIGFFQCLAMIPGTSRSAASIIGAMLLGLNRVVATEFSFFLAIPTMLGATTLQLLKVGSQLSFYELSLIFLGFILTFILSLFIVKYFLNYIKRNNFKVFGYYRIILAIILIIYMVIK